MTLNSYPQSWEMDSLAGACSLPGCLHRGPAGPGRVLLWPGLQDAGSDVPRQEGHISHLLSPGTAVVVLLDVTEV